jgi:hypothetical protein
VTYADLVERFYANPNRLNEPIHVTWAEFRAAWVMAQDSRFGEPPPKREPRWSDTRRFWLLGRPVEITDASPWPAPAA